MIIIPAIDLVDGHCVRLTHGDFGQSKTYSDNPVAVAQQFEQRGFSRLHVVDLDGARSGRATLAHIQVLEAICKETQLVVDYSGGIQTTEDVRMVFSAGAAYATVGSIAARKPEFFTVWIHSFGAESFILGADIRNGQIAISGWLETLPLDPIAYIQKWMDLGIRQVMCTAVERDGALQGPDFTLYQRILEAVPEVELIASGGVASGSNLTQLANLGLRGAIVGKALYEGTLSDQDLVPFLSRNQPVQ
jgi:phosphoribosylformimino-5-aminoimidazole carboxamide ribotide isomerase